MAIMSALVFAGQMINYTIPGTGSSGHICGGMLLTGLLGPFAGFLCMIAVLLVQCLFFADGGLMALGANIWNMAFYGCFVGYFLIWRPLMRGKFLEGKKSASRIKIIIASVVGCIAAWSTFCSNRNFTFRYYRASVRCVHRFNAADPSGNRPCGRCCNSGDSCFCK